MEKTDNVICTQNAEIPAGIPAFSANAAIAKADNGVSSAGFITQVHPQASAAAAYKWQHNLKSKEKIDGLK